MKANKVRQSIAIITLLAAGGLVWFGTANTWLLVPAAFLFVTGALLIDTLRQKADRWDE